MNQPNPIFSFFTTIRRRLASKLILMVGLILFVIISAWSHFSIAYQKEKLMANILDNASRLSNTILLGTHYAMMLNSRDDINQIINNIAKQPEIENIRIFNKKGRSSFQS
jgi:histidine kinase